MSPARLDRAVARATGESVSTIRRRGFSFVEVAPPEFDPEPCALPQIVDWDRLASQRVAVLPQRSRRAA